MAPMPQTATTPRSQEFPALDLGDWRDTKETIHRFEQIVGKIRLEASPRRNHWWNVPFHLTGRGITTRPMRDADTGRMFTIDFDFVAHRLVIGTIDGDEVSFSLPGHSVAGFHRALTSALDGLGIRTRPKVAHPFDLPDSGRPFAQDTEHRAYDPAAVTTYWRILNRVAWELEVFSAEWSGKISDVHHFWHTFDVAVTRFSDGSVGADPATGAMADPSTDPVTREAYSREVISSGFWFGDDSMPEPAFYSYTAPSPEGLADSTLRPEGARWVAQRGSSLAVLPYAIVREAPDPHAAIQDFYRSAYRAGADRAHWPADHECHAGVTDPVLV
jgi:Family of unknown function (DUF5996)